ncbi:MAG: DUF1580 domain-containing protein [Planctomycetota bacterium]
MTQREAARLLGVSFPTACRYMVNGRHGVRLPSLKIGGKRWTTREAIDWFISELQFRDTGTCENCDENRGVERNIEAQLLTEGL